MAHGIKKILIVKKEELECNNNQQSVNSICKNNKMALNNLLMLDNCCASSTTNQNLLNQKNSSTNTNALATATAAAAITHQTLPPTHATLMNNSNGNKLTLNCSGASMSTITSSTATKSPITTTTTSTATKMGSRRIFTPQFKLQVLESYRNDSDCKGNQRATARKYGIHRRQIQKWLQCENNLRSIIANNPQNVRNNAIKSIQKATAPILSSTTSSTPTSSRHRGVVGANTDKNNGATYSCFTLANVKSYKAANNDVVGSPTKSLVSQQSSSSFVTFENFASTSNVSIASANLPPHLQHHHQQHHNNHLIINNNFYFDNSQMMFNGNKIDELPIDLSCSNNNNNNNAIKIKAETVARPIPLHPTISNYKIPQFYNFSPLATPSSSSSTATSPQLIDISNSVVKSEQQHCIDPIDLSISNVSHKRKHSTDNDNKKPIKLFRPYLESNFDNNEEMMKKKEGNSDVEEDEEQQHAIIKEEPDHIQKFPIIWSNAYNFYPDHFQAQNDFPPTASSNHSFLLNTSSHHQHHLAITSSSSPSSSILSSPNDSGIMNTSFIHRSTLLPPSQASPVSGYDSSTSSIYSFNDNEVDLSHGGNSPPYSHYDAPSPLSSSATSLSPTTTETKVPLSSSSSSFIHDLKFKLYTLDCYYNDADCKRNEKLVANKLNINCKIVEKWLRQENDLRDQQKQYHLQILV